MNELALSMTERHEGRRNRLYQDTDGVWTIGVGYNIHEHGLPDWVIDRLYKEQIQIAELECTKLFQSYHKHNEARQAVLINMMFNMGYNRLCSFKNMRKELEIAAEDHSNYSAVRKEMLDSKWAIQVKSRAIELGRIMEEGRL